MRQEDFVHVVSALKAGQPQMAQEIWDGIQSGSKGMGGRQDGGSKQSSGKTVPVEQSRAQHPPTRANPPGDNLPEGMTCFLPCPGSEQDPCLTGAERSLQLQRSGHASCEASCCTMPGLLSWPLECYN